MADSTANAPQAPGKTRTRSGARVNGSAVVMVLYLLFLLLPIYWLVNMSLKTNAEILGTFSDYSK